MRRPTVPALVIIVGVLLLADLLVVNRSLGELAGLAVDAAILVGAVLGAVSAAAFTSLHRGDAPAQVRAAMHRANDLTLRR